jgi:hypothetical protein
LYQAYLQSAAEMAGRRARGDDENKEEMLIAKVSDFKLPEWDLDILSPIDYCETFKESFTKFTEPNGDACSYGGPGPRSKALFSHLTLMLVTLLSNAYNKFKSTSTFIESMYKSYMMMYRSKEANPERVEKLFRDNQIFIKTLHYDKFSANLASNSWPSLEAYCTYFKANVSLYEYGANKIPESVLCEQFVRNCPNGHCRSGMISARSAKPGTTLLELYHLANCYEKEGENGSDKVMSKQYFKQQATSVDNDGSRTVQKTKSDTKGHPDGNSKSAQKRRIDEGHKKCSWCKSEDHYVEGPDGYLCPKALKMLQTNIAKFDFSRSHYGHTKANINVVTGKRTDLKDQRNK